MAYSYTNFPIVLTTIVQYLTATTDLHRSPDSEAANFDGHVMASLKTYVIKWPTSALLQLSARPPDLLGDVSKLIVGCKFYGCASSATSSSRATSIMR